MTKPLLLRPQQLVIVQRGYPQILAAVQVRYGEAATIILDRRQGERRRTVRPVPVERREVKDRRRPLLPPEETMWQEAHYRIVYRAPGSDS